MSRRIRELIGLPIPALESVKPIKFRVIESQYGIPILDQTTTDIHAVVTMTEGIGGAVLKLKIYNAASLRINMFRKLAEDNTAIELKLGYDGFDFEKIGKFILLSAKSVHFAQPCKALCNQ